MMPILRRRKWKLCKLLPDIRFAKSDVWIQTQVGLTPKPGLQVDLSEEMGRSARYASADLGSCESRRADKKEVGSANCHGLTNNSHG